MRQDLPQPTSPGRSARPSRKPTRFEELEVVYLLVSRPESGLARGEAGTIVHAVTKPAPAYLVEFVDHETGYTRAEEFFTPDQLSRTPPPP
jgi:hypothetical protein